MKARTIGFKLAPIVLAKSQEIPNGPKIRTVFTNVLSKNQELNDHAGSLKDKLHENSVKSENGTTENDES